LKQAKPSTFYFAQQLLPSFSDEVTTEPEVGDLFALISDEVWCRVKVIAVNGGKVQVFFVDHGDEIETTKTELRPLADQFRKLPFQVRWIVRSHKACFPPSEFDWLATNTDDINSQSHSFFTFGAKKIAQWETGLIFEA
jgi:ribosomal protein L31